MINVLTNRWTQLIAKSVAALGGPVLAGTVNAWVGLIVGVVGLACDLLIHWKREKDAAKSEATP